MPCWSMAARRSCRRSSTRCRTASARRCSARRRGAAPGAATMTGHRRARCRSCRTIARRCWIPAPPSRWSISSRRGAARHGGGDRMAAQDAARRQDRHDQRAERHLVRGLLARPGGGRLYRLRRSEAARAEGAGRLGFGAGLRRVHGRRAQGQGRWSISAFRRTSAWCGSPPTPGSPPSRATAT